MKTVIDLPRIADTGTFARYEPPKVPGWFGLKRRDDREVIVRRGKELGFDYGLRIGSRRVNLGDRQFEMVTYRQVLSPPPLRPGMKPIGTEAAEHYQPVSDVLFLPGAEVLLPRHPDGFTDAEVERILDAIRVIAE